MEIKIKDRLQQTLMAMKRQSVPSVDTLRTLSELIAEAALANYGEEKARLMELRMRAVIFDWNFQKLFENAELKKYTPVTKWLFDDEEATVGTD
jgi:hypothetical protein